MANQIDPAAQREFAVDVVERLRAAGHVAYWAGGCVRDALLGRQPKDFDVATGARPDEIRDLFGHQRTLAIGAAFGVITVLGKKSAGPIEVATFRQDAAYSDGRHPDAVIFSTPEQDALRRDFTINGLFYDPVADQVLDFVGGQNDLKAGVIRAIGEPRERFSEDKLRLLRAVRFAIRFSFAIESATRQAIEEMADQIKVVSIERIATELRLILLKANLRQGVEMLDDVGLLAVTMSTVCTARDLATQAGHDEWPLTLDVLDKLEEPSFPLALAAARPSLAARGASRQARPKPQTLNGRNARSGLARRKLSKPARRAHAGMAQVATAVSRRRGRRVIGIGRSDCSRHRR